MKTSRNESGVGAVELLLILVVIGILGFTSWFVWHGRQATNETLENAGKSSTPAKVAPRNPQKANVPTSNLTYTSASEKAVFTYPSTWKKVAASAQNSEPTGEAVGFESPDGKVTVSWVAGIGGVGGACDPDIAVGSTGKDGLQSCGSSEVISSTPVMGASGLYVVEGTYATDTNKYYPWLAVQSGTGTTSQREMGYELYAGKHVQGSVLFAIGDIGKGSPAPSFTTKAAAQAFLQTESAAQAKQILLSLKYQ